MNGSGKNANEPPQQNDHLPIREPGQLSPPVVRAPIHECARAVHVEGFIPHALVTVWANLTEQIASDHPIVGFYDFQLSRALVVGDRITATQEAFGLTSDHSFVHVPVDHQPSSLAAPVVGNVLYDCGRVVPVDGLTPSTHVEVYQGPTNPPAVTPANLIGTGDATGHWLPVVTSALAAGQFVISRQISCPGTSHEIASPISATAVQVAPEPNPLAKPVLDPVIPGNDTVNLEQLYIGAAIDVRDETATADIGDGLATGDRNWSHVSPRIDGSHHYRANQKLCSASPFSDPAHVLDAIDPPVLISDICPGDRTVRIDRTILNATVVLMRGATVIGVGGAVPGELELGVGSGFTIVEGDDIYARQYIGAILSADSNHVRVADCRNVVTQHNDKWRRGAYLHETSLSPASVGGAFFGRLFERNVHGDQLAQILYVRNVAGTRLGTKNLFFAATSTNEVYAFDADDHNSDPNSGLVWKTEPLGPTRLLNSTEICTETIGTVGITSTPVIDVTSQTMYVVARHWANAGPPSAAGSQDLVANDYLHALNLHDGSARAAPRKVEGTDPRNGITFDSTVQRNRPGLLLLNGVVYLGFGTFSCDQGDYHGWVFGYAADNLSPRAIFCTTESDPRAGGIWQSGNGLVGSDDGHVFFETGNPIPAIAELGDAFVKLRTMPEWPGLELVDHFRPSNAAVLERGDTDLGSGGPVLLPGNRLIGGGKQGRYYVLDTATMQLTQDTVSPDPAQVGEGFQAFQNTYHPEYPEGHYADGELFGPNIHGGPIYWPGPSNIYQMPEKDLLKAYFYDRETGIVHHEAGPALSATIKPPNGMPGGHSSLSANGDRDGIVWTLVPSADGQWGPVPGTLHAFDGMTLREIWADLLPERFATFNPPTIADGKVFRPVFAQYSWDQARDPAPSRIGPGKVIVYGSFARFWPPPLPWPGGWRRWWGGGDPAPKWTVQEFVERMEGSGLVAFPLDDETAIGDSRGGSRRDFRGTISNRRRRVSSQKLTDLSETAFHRPPRDVVEVLASIFWSEATGAHAVLGEIREEYLRRGGTGGELGYPISSEVDTPDDRGRVSRFEHGDIFWYPDVGAEARVRGETRKGR